MAGAPSLWRNRQLLAVSTIVCSTYTGIGAVAPVRVLYAQSRGASLAVIAAMASAFLLANFAAQYPGGALSDRIGRRRVILAGLVAQLLLSLSYLVVHDAALFVVLRLAEGVAAAMVLPAARAMVADATEPEERGHAYGIFSAFFNAGFLIGPGIGGLLAGVSYDSVFVFAALVRIPAILVALLVLPAGTGRGANAPPWQSASSFLWQPALLGAYILAFGDYLYIGFDQTLMPLWIRHNLGAPVVAIGIISMLWAVPTIALSPFTGRLADRVRRSTLILVFGLAQVPIYLAYGLLSNIVAVAALFTVHAAIYAVVQPAVDAHVAAASPADSRARVQSAYSAMGLLGAFAGANAFGPIYALNWRLPLPVEGLVFAVCVVVGGGMIRASEARPAGMTRSAAHT